MGRSRLFSKAKIYFCSTDSGFLTKKNLGDTSIKDSSPGKIIAITHDIEALQKKALLVLSTLNKSQPCRTRLSRPKEAARQVGESSNRLESFMMKKIPESQGNERGELALTVNNFFKVKKVANNDT